MNEEQMSPLEELSSRNPYPDDVFLDKTKDEWIKFHKLLKEAGLSSEGFMGSFGRMVWNNCIVEYQRIIRERADNQPYENVKGGRKDE